jgi:hypothetical protein
MAAIKYGATALSAAVLAACAPPQQFTDYDDTVDIVCTKEAPVSSHIKEERCVRVSANNDSGKPSDDDPFNSNPKSSNRSAEQAPLPTYDPPPPPEASCGAQTDD